MRTVIGIVMALIGWFCAAGQTIADCATQDTIMDFPFVDRDGHSTTLYAEIATLTSCPSCAQSPSCSSCSPVKNKELFLLLFDPDCDECHALIDELTTATEPLAVIAVYPVDAPLAEEDPNFLAYRRACAELPQEWVVGIDNGAILDGDLYLWDHLPLLIRLPAPAK